MIQLAKRTPKVSVIVPAYNAEMYLERCLNSIAAQTMPDFECIIVDDGSKDRTGEIADDFAKKDSRFRVVHQENGGVSVARQTGVDTATGIYTIQFDADDWVEADILQEMLAAAEPNNADMVICDIYSITNKGEAYESQQPIQMDRNVVWGLMMQPQLHAALWNKLIKRECYQIFGIRFVPGMLMEDQYICLSLLSHPIEIAYVPKALYHYDKTQNPHSFVNTGISPEIRLWPLDLIAASTDISEVQDYFDQAILYIAYEALFFPKEQCPDYPELFKKHLPSIRRAKGFPFRVKLLVWLRIHGINIPIRSIKKLFGR